MYEDAHRYLDGHKVNPANDVLTIEALDGPGPGGASHHYFVTGFDVSKNPVLGMRPPVDGASVIFQHGPINEAGVNGLTHEALLAILIDRLEAFQRGPYSNDYNAAALAHLQSAQGALLDRTRERMARNVEGTHAQ